MTLVCGQPVQVEMVWAGGPPGWPPLRNWFSGYEFYKYDEGDTNRRGGTHALVFHRRGTFSGCLVRYAVSEIRPEVSQ